jgi:hypothetical protein
MAVFHFNEEAEPHNDEIQLGYCENCRQFHLTAGPMTLSFEVPELAEFLNSAMEVYWDEALRGTIKMPDFRVPERTFPARTTLSRKQHARVTKELLS